MLAARPPDLDPLKEEDPAAADVGGIPRGMESRMDREWAEWAASGSKIPPAVPSEARVKEGLLLSDLLMLMAPVAGEVASTSIPVTPVTPSEALKATEDRLVNDLLEPKDDGCGARLSLASISTAPSDALVAIEGLLACIMSITLVT